MSDAETAAPAASVPTGCPISHDFDAFDGDNYAYYAKAREQHPVFYSPQIDSYVVTRYEDIYAIEMDTETFSAEQALAFVKALTPESINILVSYGYVPTKSMVDEDPPLHTRRRKMLRKGLTPAVQAQMEDYIRELTTMYLDEMVKRGEADLVRDMFFELPALVIFRLMGVPDEDLPRVRKFAKRLAVWGWGNPSDEEQAALCHDIGQYHQYAREHITRLRENPGDDIMSIFVQEMLLPENADQYDENYTYTIMLNLLFAGHETSTNALAGAFRALLENRDQWEALVADPSLIPNAVEECLRYYPSAPQWRRTTTKDTVVGGVPIPANAMIVMALGSGNHDDAKFPEGEKLDIRRANAKEHLAFGVGRHLCLGAPLARLEMQVVFEEVARRLPHIQLVPNQPWLFSPNILHRGPEHVLVTWDPTQNPLPEDRL